MKGGLGPIKAAIVYAVGKTDPLLGILKLSPKLNRCGLMHEGESLLCSVIRCSMGPLSIEPRNVSSARVKAMLDLGADPNLRVWPGSVPLAIAVRAQRWDIVQDLDRAGANWTTWVRNENNPAIFDKISHVFARTAPKEQLRSIFMNQPALYWRIDESGEHIY